MSPSRVQIPLGGLWVQCYGVSELLARPEEDREALVLFFLHGRFGSAERIEHIVEKTYDDAVAQLAAGSPSSDSGAAGGPQGSHGANRPRHLIIVTFDQRNHGTRKISHKGQQSWTEGNLEHAQAMLAMQTGTADDVSFIADFLPSFLFPNDEARLTKWAVTGISLGGHSTWIVLKNDPRFDIGVPMLGCPSYRVLMKHRAATANLPFEPPYMPKSLLTLLDRVDPDSVNYSSEEAGADNPYLGKKILVLSGEIDELVPWQCSKTFADNLKVGPHGRKEIILEPGKGHETSAFMIGELVKWIVQYGMERS